MTVYRFGSHAAACLLAPAVAYYICRQRNRLESAATALPEHLQKKLRHYFSSVDLQRVRIIQRDPLPIPDPPFYPQLLRLGLDFPSPSLTAAITFDGVIASRVAINASLLFHELVHVVQFRLLGVMKFSRFYVQGFLSGGSYYDIPLERCAFELERRFETEQLPFDVEAEVAAWIERKLF